MHPALNYSFKVWLTTILLAPALMLAAMKDSGHVDKLVLYPVFVVYGGIFGLPPLVLWTWLTSLLCRKLTGHFKIKGYLSLIFIMLTLLTFFMLSGFRLPWQTASWYLPYSLVALLCIWAFPLPKRSFP